MIHSDDLTSNTGCLISRVDELVVEGLQCYKGCILHAAFSESIILELHVALHLRNGRFGWEEG